MAGPFAVPVAGAGALWLMPCPGRGDFGALAQAGVSVVLSMLSEADAQALNVQDEAELCAAEGLHFIHHPIDDFGLPEMQRFAALIKDITLRIAQGAGVVVHCRAGIGRSGMVAAAVRIVLGDAPDQAIETVTQARGVAIPDTVAQMQFIHRFAEIYDAERG